MAQTVDLISYLPPFLAEYNQIREALEAEVPEFNLVWEAADRVLKNEFIETADEYGIERFEKMLNIYPSSEDTLASRKKRVQARWFVSLPYTERMLLEKLAALCGKNNFTFKKNYAYYRIGLEVSLELFGQIEELESLIGVMLPCNMAADITNNIMCAAKGEALTVGGVCTVHTFFISNDFKEEFRANGRGIAGSGVAVAEFFEERAGN